MQLLDHFCVEPLGFSHDPGGPGPVLRRPQRQRRACRLGVPDRSHQLDDRLGDDQDVSAHRRCHLACRGTGEGQLDDQDGTVGPKDADLSGGADLVAGLRLDNVTDGQGHRVGRNGGVEPGDLRHRSVRRKGAAQLIGGLLGLALGPARDDHMADLDQVDMAQTLVKGGVQVVGRQVSHGWICAADASPVSNVGRHMAIQTLKHLDRPARPRRC